MRKKLALLLAASIVTCGTVGILSACGGGSEADNYKPGGSVVDKKEGNFIYDGNGNILFEQREGTVYEAKYFVNDSSYVTLSGEKVNEMVLNGYVGDITELSVSEIEKNLVIDNNKISVVGVANEAFAGCETLKTVDLAKENISLGFTVASSAFENCIGLESVKLPENIYTNTGAVGSNAFKNCTALTTVELGAKVNEIGSAAFYNCTALASVTIPENVSVISDDTFSYCDSLATLNVNEGKLKSIKSGAFYNTAIHSLDLGKLTNLRFIGESAFQNSKLSSLTLPESVTYIGSQAFFNCKNLNNIHIPFLGNSISSGVSFNSIYGSSGKDTRTLNVTVDSVTTIPQNAFAGNQAIKSVTVKEFTKPGAYKVYEPDGVSFNRVDVVEADDYNEIPTQTVVMKAVGGGAFYGCEKLQSVTLPADVEAIGNSAFYGCEDLTTFYMPAELKTIGSYAFAGCERLYNFTQSASASDNAGKLTLPSKLVSIGNNAFRNCDDITEVVLPASVEQVSDDAFYGCWVNTLTIARLNGIQPVYYDDDEKVVDEYKYVSLANLASWFDEYTQKNRLKTVTVSSLYTLPDYIFADFNYISTLNLTFKNYDESLFDKDSDNYYPRPSGLPLSSEIGDRAFYDCINLINLTISDEDAIIQSIGSSAFYNCSRLDGFTVPATVTSIGNNAFELCRTFTNFTVPASVTSLGNAILKDCEDLTSVTIEKYSQVVTTDEEAGFIPISSSTYYTYGNLSTQLFGTSLNSEDGGYWLENNMYKTTSGVYVPNSLKTVTVNDVCGLAANSFKGWKNLETVNISFIKSFTIGEGNKITSIGSSAFEGCVKLENLNVTNGSYVKNINASAFKGCKLITDAQVAVFDSLRSLGNYAFSGCVALTVANLPAMLTSVGSYVYYGCYNIATLNIGNYKVINSNVSSLFDAEGAKVELPVSGSSYLTEEVVKFALIGGKYVPLALETVTVSGISKLSDLKTYLQNISMLKVVSLNYTTEKTSEIINLTSDPFSGCTSLVKVFIPETLTKLYVTANYGFGNGAVVGSATLYIKSAYQPAQYGNYWKYDADNEPEIWTYPGGSYTFNFSGVILEEGETKSETKVVEKEAGALLESDIPAVTNEGKTLVGWFTNEECTGTPVSFPYFSESDTTLYAKWLESDNLKEIAKDKFSETESMVYSTNSSGIGYYKITVWQDITLTCKAAVDKESGVLIVNLVKAGGSTEETLLTIDNRYYYSTNSEYYNTNKAISLTVDIKAGESVMFIYKKTEYDMTAGSAQIVNINYVDYVAPAMPAAPVVPQFPEDKVDVSEIVGDLHGTQITESKFNSVMGDVFGEDGLQSFTADAYYAGVTELKGVKYDLENKKIHGEVLGIETYIDYKYSYYNAYIYMKVPMDEDGLSWIRMYGDMSDLGFNPPDNGVEAEQVYEEYTYDATTGSYWAAVSGVVNGVNAKVVIALTVDSSNKAYVTVAAYIEDVLQSTFRYYEINNTTVTIPADVINNSIPMGSI